MAKTKPFPRDLEPAWTAFWAAYPRKVGKAMARDLFAEAVASGADPDFLVRACERQAEAWRRTGAQEMYLPHAKTWLRQRMYEDDALADPRLVYRDPCSLPDHELWPAFAASGMTEDRFRRWIAPVDVVWASDGTARELIAPTPFHADRLRGPMEPEIRRALGGVPEITVRGT